jgi:hypothetical protein
LFTFIKQDKSLCLTFGCYIYHTMTKYFLTALILFFTTKGLAQSNADTTQSANLSPVKTMSYEQYKAYLDGVDLSNMALVAQLNHYPDPEKVMVYKKELKLNAEQTAAITGINKELKRKMKEMGALIIKNEITLDNLFSTKKLNDGTLIFYGQRTDLFKGELRNAILQAYVKVADILSEGQTKKYEELQKAEH